MLRVAPSNPGEALSVGDPRRVAVGRVAVETLLAVVLFTTFIVLSKEIRGIYRHTPWQDDPYDALVSFAVFFVPLIAGILLVRLPLCRRDQPLPLQRVHAVLRGSRVALGAMLATVLGDWTSVALRASQPNWNSTTALLVGLLVLLTAGIGAIALRLRRASRPLPSFTRGSPGSDWLADAVAVGKQYSAGLGPLKTAGLRVLVWLDERALARIRRHPLATAAAVSLAFGLVLAANTSIAEGVGPLVWLDVAVGASAMFACSVAAGSYLALVHGQRQLAGTRRRLTDAAVLGCASVPVALAFRDELWWLIGAHQGGDGAGLLLELLAVAAVSTFVVLFAAETLARAHAPLRSSRWRRDAHGV